MNTISKPVRVAAAIALCGGVTLTAGVGSAQAIGSDLNGSRINWSSAYQCYDGGGIVSGNVHWSYVTPSAGYYRTRLGMYDMNSGARLALGPLQDWTRTSTLGISPQSWSPYFGYGGQAEVTAFVYRWNGADYVLVARETLPCW